MTQLLTKVKVQLSECEARDFYVVDDGNALAFCHVPFPNGAPVSASNPLPVVEQGGAGPLVYTEASSASVGVASGTIVAAGAFKTIVRIATLPGSTTNVWLHPDGTPAIVGTGDCVLAGGGSFAYGTEDAPMPAGNITAITDSGAPQTVTITGG